MTNEIVNHTALSIGQGFATMRLDYIPYLREFLIIPLIQKGTEGVPEVIALLDAYGLSRDDFIESMKDLQMVKANCTEYQLRDRIDSLESKIKAAFTRTYNAGEHTSQALVASQGVSKRSKRKASNTENDEVETEAGNIINLFY